MSIKSSRLKITTRQELRERWLKAVQLKWIEEEVFEKGVEDGIWRLVGIDARRRMMYGLTELGMELAKAKRGPHLVNPPKTEQ